MNSAVRSAGAELAKYFLQNPQGRQDLKKGAGLAVEGIKKTGQALTGLGQTAGRVAEEAVLAGAPAAREFAGKFAANRGLLGDVARAASKVSDDQIIGAAVGARKIAEPVSKGVAVLGTSALVGGALSKPDSYYSLPMQEIAAREAAAYGLVDAKLAADTERQLGNSRLAQEKFEQSLYLQNQRQQHEMMMASARQEARTPRNQPMYGSDLFDPMASSSMVFSSLPKNYGYSPNV